MAQRISARPRYQAGKCLLVGAVVSALMLAVVGHPKPATPKPRGTQAYPCQHHQCGCADAKQCWASCCCMSRTEKLAWARRHGITPPPELTYCADDGGFSAAGQRCGGCCHGARRSPELTEPEPAAPEESDGWVIGAHWRKCRGGGVEWVLSGAILVSLGEAKISRPAMSGRNYPAIQLGWFSIAAPPDVPPPRSVLLT